MTPTTQAPKTAAKPAAKAAAPAKTATPAATVAPAHKDSGKFLAVVRVRGAPKMTTAIEFALHHLNLDKRHACVVLADTLTNRGMIRKVNSFVAWGEVTPETVKELETKRAGPKKHQFALQSPRKGFTRKGIKLPNKAGGSLGQWGKKINELIMRMV